MKRPTERRIALSLVVGLSVLVLAEVTVRGGHRWLAGPLDWYSCFAQLKADEMERHKGTPAWATTAFVGDSAVMSAFDPAVWQATSACEAPAYNAGIPGATPRVIELWLKDAVVPSLHPRVVVIGLTSRAFNLKGTDGAYGAYRGALAVRDDIGSRLTKLVGRFSRLIRYRSILRDPIYLKPTLLKLLGRAPEEPWSRPSRRGFFPEDKSRPYSVGAYHNARSTVFRDYDVSDVETAALGRSVAFLREHGIGVVLADMPVSDDYPELHPGGSATYERYRTALEAFAAAHAVPLVTFPELHENRLFVDPIHMNSEGSVRFTRSVEERTATCGTLEAKQ